jgi:hypothetical protein
MAQQRPQGGLDAVRQGTRVTTLRGYEWLIRQHIRPGLGNIRLVPPQTAQ